MSGELGMRLDVPELTSERSGYLVVPPLEEQAAKLQTALEREPNSIVCHSQGAWVLALALGVRPQPREQRLTLLAPPLTPAVERMSRRLAEPSEYEKNIAGDYGGTHGVIRGNTEQDPIVVSGDYWEEVSDPGFPPRLLVTQLLNEFEAPRIIRPGNDRRLGPQTEEYRQLETDAVVHVDTIGRATHSFSGIEEQVARAAFTGCVFDVATQGGTYAVTISS